MPSRAATTDPAPEPAVAPYLAALARLGGAELSRLRVRLRQCLREADVADVPSTVAPAWEAGPVPLVLTADEWRPLEAALKQRTRLVNALLLDIYSKQEVLRARVLPPEIVFRDPYFRRPAVGLEPARTNPATLLRFDLVNTAGGWMFDDTHVNTPIGLGFAVQNRRILTQEAGELYRTLPDCRRISDFPLRLLEALQALAPGGVRNGDGVPAIVLLTPGPSDPVYFEHGFLARKMGVPLARGDDLLVVDNRVYFKTIAGLEPVGVIYRRLNDAHIDPVVFPTPDEVSGIPGLLQCIRRGSVAVANAIGAGVAENRALHAFLAPLTRFYLAEAPLLPSVPTYYPGDPDVLDLLLDRREMRVRPAHGPTPGMPRPARDRPLAGHRGALRALQRAPHAHVVQQAVCPAPLLAAAGNGRPAPVRLCAYALCAGRRITVLPGGLAVVGSELPPPEVIGTTADTVVLAGEGVRPARARSETIDAPAPPSVGRLVPGSRAAECLFWLGRYLERAESSARMLSILEEVGLEEIPRAERRRWLPLWQGVLKATGNADEGAGLSPRVEASFSAERLWRMALGDRREGSIVTSVEKAWANAGQTREYVSPEAWVVLHRLDTRLQTIRAGSRPDIPTSARARRGATHGGTARLRSAARLCAQAALAGINGFLATADRTMLHDAGWQFVRAGMHLERAIVTCSALRHVLGAALSAGDEPTGGGNRENPALAALLRMLGSQDAYRRLYRMHATPRPVADFFLRQPEAPRSIYHCLLETRAALDSVAGAHGTAVEPAEAAARLLAWLDRTSAESGVTSIYDRLDNLLGLLLRLAQIVNDHHFSHQARLPEVGLRQTELAF